MSIVRNKIGDIFFKDNQAYVYCMDDTSGYIAENLKKIKHTIVKCIVKDMEAVNITPEFKIIKGTISNIRLDSLIATALGTSRSSIISFIESGKVFINGRWLHLTDTSQNLMILFR